jgi:hypothetical protein
VSNARWLTAYHGVHLTVATMRPRLRWPTSLAC